MENIVEVATAEVEQQKENETSLQDKFNNLETKLKDTREEGKEEVILM